MDTQPCKRGCATPQAPDDNQLETRVRSQLAGQIREFRLVILANGLVLRGRSRTYYAKQLAQHAVMAATKVPIVANEIEVVTGSDYQI